MEIETMITYRIEFWNPVTRKYELGWEGKDFEQANRTYIKPYNNRHTRRLLSISTQLIAKHKAKD
jgi:hypothetical protein